MLPPRNVGAIALVAYVVKDKCLFAPTSNIKKGKAAFMNDEHGLDDRESMSEESHMDHMRFIVREPPSLVCGV